MFSVRVGIIVILLPPPPFLYAALMKSTAVMSLRDLRAHPTARLSLEWDEPFAFITEIQGTRIKSVRRNGSPEMLNLAQIHR